MIRHVVVFRWHEQVTDEHIAALSAALDTLPGAVGTIHTYRHGRDVGVNATSFDYAVTADFVTVDDYLTYRDHPAHQQVIADHIAGRASERAAVQFEFDD
jgi:hypothetical protein